MYSYAPTSDFDVLKRGCVVALGCFDGVHIGHRMLIEKAKSIANEKSLPLAVYSPESSKGQAYLTTPDEKKALLHAYGADAVILADFDEIKDLSAEDFVCQILVKELNCQTAVCGFNFRFGKYAAGDCNTLQHLLADLDRSTIILPACQSQGEDVSSTRIRNLLKNADVERASELLSRPYFVTGKVTKGRQIGRTLGFPTANILFPEGKLIPQAGVYYCRVKTAFGVYGAICNIGIHPTFDDPAPKPLLEANLFDFEADLYDSKVQIELVSFLRPEKRFDSPAILAETVYADIERAKAMAAADPILMKELI